MGHWLVVTVEVAKGHLRIHHMEEGNLYRRVCVCRYVCVCVCVWVSPNLMGKPEGICSVMKSKLDGNRGHSVWQSEHC